MWTMFDCSKVIMNTLSIFTTVTTITVNTIKVPSLQVQPCGQEGENKRVRSFLDINSERVSTALSKGGSVLRQDHELRALKYTHGPKYQVCIYLKPPKSDNRNLDHWSSFPVGASRMGSSPNIFTLPPSIYAGSITARKLVSLVWFFTGGQHWAMALGMGPPHSP